MNMKKILAILSATALVFAVAGCASTKKAATKDDAKADAAPAVATINNPDPTGEIELLDGFEEGNYWQAVGDSWDQWGSHNLSLAAETTDKWASEGTTAGEWQFDVHAAGTSQQSCFFCDALADVDWTGAKYLVCDINNINSEPIQMNVAVQASDAWSWSQTAILTLGVGVNKNVMFDLCNGILDGSNNAIPAIVGIDQIKRGIIQVVGENKGGTIYIDNIRLVR
jgi:hypothetical protein